MVSFVYLIIQFVNREYAFKKSTVCHLNLNDYF